MSKIIAMSGDAVFPNWDDFLTISGVVGGLRGINAIIGWGTNIPSTSKVYWGTTEALGNETTIDNDLVLHHFVEFTGFGVDERICFQCESTSPLGYTALSEIYYIDVGKEKEIFILFTPPTATLATLAVGQQIDKTMLLNELSSTYTTHIDNPLDDLFADVERDLGEVTAELANIATTNNIDASDIEIIRGLTYVYDGGAETTIF